MDSNLDVSRMNEKQTNVYTPKMNASGLNLDCIERRCLDWA